MNPGYKKENAAPAQKKIIRRSHFWQALSISLGGFLLITLIVSLKGISLLEKTLFIEEPYTQNDPSKSVCVTFTRNAEKHWVDEADPDRTGAQFDGMIYNNMSSTIITDWSFSIFLPDNCSIDPGPWNGTFTITDSSLSVIKPHKDDAENIHGEDFIPSLC